MSTTRIEAEYRVTPGIGDDSAPDVFDAWTRVGRTWAPGEDVAFDGLDLGRTYDVRVRSVDEATGAASPWSLWPGITIERDSGVPPAPTGVRLTKDGCLTWEMPMEVLDLVGFRVRHATGADECWERAEPAHEGLVACAPFLLCRVPKGRRTFLVVAVDADGNESEPATMIANRGPVDDKAEFEVASTDQTAFGGTISGGTASGGVLTADLQDGSAGDQPMFGCGVEPWIPVDGASPMIPLSPDGDLFAPVWAGHTEWIPRRGGDPMFGTTIRQWIEYVWTHTVRTGEHGPRSVMSVDVEVVAATYGHEMPWRLMYRRPSSRAWIPVNPWDPMIPSDGTDEMLPTEPMRLWQPWPGRVLGVEAGAWEFRLLVPGSHQRARVRRLAVSVSSEPRVRHVTGLAVPANGGTRVPPGDAWAKIVEVRVLPRTGEPTDAPVRSTSKVSGPTVETYQGGAATAATVDVVLRGY